MPGCRHVGIRPSPLERIRSREVLPGTLTEFTSLRQDPSEPPVFDAFPESGIKRALYVGSHLFCTC